MAIPAILLLLFSFSFCSMGQRIYGNGFSDNGNNGADGEVGGRRRYFADENDRGDHTLFDQTRTSSSNIQNSLMRSLFNSMAVRIGGVENNGDFLRINLDLRMENDIEDDDDNDRDENDENGNESDEENDNDDGDSMESGELIASSNLLGFFPGRKKEKERNENSCRNYNASNGAKSIGCVYIGCCQYTFQIYNLEDCPDTQVCCFSDDICRDIPENPPATECPPIVSRSEWGAQPPKKIDALPKQPVKFATIHHTSGFGCVTRTRGIRCRGRLQQIQRKHFSEEYSDIGYSFLVNGEGRVFEGRGWDREGGHTYGYNKNGLGFAFIGNFEKRKPTEAALSSMKQLLACGVTNGKLEKRYILQGHRDTDNSIPPTDCPGQALYDEIQTWPHFRDQ